MKVRLGFVTNSSSSSFICGDCREIRYSDNHIGAFNYTGPYKVNKVTFGEEGYELFKTGEREEIKDAIDCSS